MTGDPYIQIRNLTKKFKDKTALDQVNLDVQQGDLFGLVGPDGAGKTTLLRTLAGLLGITEGSVLVAGVDLTKNPEQIKSHLGYMAQAFSLYGNLSVIENLQFFGELYDVSPSTQAERTPDLLDFAQLTEFVDRRAAKLSGGMKKKLALACTLLHRPPILLLDEPTTGVDPVSRREFWNILNELHLQGTTILVSTPYMDEADRCSQVALIYNGRIVECDSPHSIRNRLGAEVLRIVTNDWQRTRTVLLPLPGVVEVQSYGDAVHVLLDSIKNRSTMVRTALEENNLQILELREITPRMEEAFISYIHKLEQEN